MIFLTLLSTYWEYKQILPCWVNIYARVLSLRLEDNLSDGFSSSTLWMELKEFALHYLPKHLSGFNIKFDNNKDNLQQTCSQH